MTPTEPIDKNKPKVCICPKCMRMFEGTISTPITEQCDICKLPSKPVDMGTTPTFIVKDLNLVNPNSQPWTEGSIRSSSLNNSNNDNP